jgi:hypothetical protein
MLSVSTLHQNESKRCDVVPPVIFRDELAYTGERHCCMASMTQDGLPLEQVRARARGAIREADC